MLISKVAVPAWLFPIYRKSTCQILFVVVFVHQLAAGFYVRAAIKYPKFMKYVPTLLPGKFLNLLKRGKEEETEGTKVHTENQKNISILAKLEELIKTEVWKFGFGYVSKASAAWVAL